MPTGPIHPANLPPAELLRQCRARRMRRSGPGGQRRNKVETAVVLEHHPTGVRAEASERRSQAENQRIALDRLRMKLALQVRRERDVLSEPSTLWKRRCRGGRIVVSPRHADFPALLAEALDVLFSLEGDVPASAETLGCTASQLLKLLRAEPLAMGRLNELRMASGLRLLK
jgi:hypothetical protein